MDKLEQKLKDLKDMLEKGMNNSGIGGPGAVKLGAVLPSIKIKTPGKNNNSATPSIGKAPASKKNPIKQAEQTQNKDIKDIKMKEAQAALAMKKGEEIVKYADNGQWKIEKADKYVHRLADQEISGETDKREPGYVPDNKPRKPRSGERINRGQKKVADTGTSTLSTHGPADKEGWREGLKEGKVERRRSNMKLVKKTAREEMLEVLEKRCWDGYEPTPGKKAYEEDSCRPVKKRDIEVAPEGSKNRESYKDEFEKKEDKPFHGYNKDKHSKEGGMSAKAREKHNRETGSNLKKPVTAKEAKNSEEKAGRRKSFCARMSGVKGPTSKDGKLTRKGAALKRWDC